MGTLADFATTLRSDLSYLRLVVFAIPCIVTGVDNNGAPLREPKPKDC